MMYYEYFRLKGPPFQPASPDSAVYFSPTHMQALATLESGLSGELTGLTLLTGEAGTGKTTLIYSLLQRDYKRVRIALIDDPKLSFLEIMRLVLAQMKLYSTGTTKLDYLETLDRLLELRGDEERIALIVDESQVLSDDVLEELRLLSNRGKHRLQLILVGQPELAERLRQPHLRQLNQRISSRGMLKSLNSAQAIKYVECKLSAQGSSCTAIFARGALKYLLRYSDGIPRKINMLCHTAMNAAYYAGERKVSYKTARKVAIEYHNSVKIKRGRLAALVKPALIASGAIAALAIVAFAVGPHLRPGKVKTSSLGAPANHSARPVAASEQANRASAATSAEQAKSVTPGGTIAAKPVEPAGAVAQPAAPPAAPHGGIGAVASAMAAPDAHPVAPAASIAPAAAPDAASPNGAAHQPHSADGRIASTAPGAGAGAVAAKPAPAAQRSEIAVRDGDTLEKIAIRYLGSKTAMGEIIGANPQLTDINRLSVGEVLYLPPGVSAKSPHDQTVNADPAPDAENSTSR